MVQWLRNGARAQGWRSGERITGIAQRIGDGTVAQGWRTRSGMALRLKDHRYSAKNWGWHSGLGMVQRIGDGTVA
jgi:hypothetical protein